MILPNIYCIYIDNNSILFFNIPCFYCVYRRVVLCPVGCSPDGAVQGGAEDEAAVLREAQRGHPLGVGPLKPAQTQPTVELPHLHSHTHTHTRTRTRTRTHAHTHTRDSGLRLLSFVYIKTYVDTSP